MELFTKYVSLRPKNVNHRMSFLGYRISKCIAQTLEIHSIARDPNQMARCTGHSFRSSTTLLANAGADLVILKKYKNLSVAEKYLKDSLENKKK